MAHKQKNRQKNTETSTSSPIVEQRIADTRQKESPKDSQVQSESRESGLSWQPMLVIAAMAIGLIIVLLKVLGLL